MDRKRPTKKARRPLRRFRSGPAPTAFLKRAPKLIREQLAQAGELSTFLASAGTLSKQDRLRLVEQALTLLEKTYVHLPLKEAMHGINPLQRLRLLAYRLGQTEEAQLPTEARFHAEMLAIFNSCRDLHTNYVLPAPFSRKIAFLPFQVEEFFEGGALPRYLVSRLLQGFAHPTFRPGVEILHWNGVPIARAVELDAELQAGSNSAARRARGVEALTIRPLGHSLPPDEEWVVIGYRTVAGEEPELRQEWLVFNQGAEDDGGGGGGGLAVAAACGLDLKSEAVRRAKIALFVPRVLADRRRVRARPRRLPTAAGAEIPTQLPGVFKARSVTTPNGEFGYVRIFSFNVDDDRPFVDKLVRLAGLLPQDGLIVDVRGNGGGLIYASERLLQVLTPRPIEPEPVQFINSPLTFELCRRHSPSPLDPDFDLSPWRDSIAQAIETGAAYSRSFPITPAERANDLGQRYHGPVVLVTDALCYSATDIFAAGFKDHRIGPILGTSGNTGAGGANVWTHGLLRQLWPGTASPFKPLPAGSDMRVAIRRTVRVGDQAGTPVEDLGVVPDQLHLLTRADLLEDNRDLIRRAAQLLAAATPRSFAVELLSLVGGQARLRVTTRNVARLDVAVGGRPRLSVDVSNGPNTLDVPGVAAGAALGCSGFDTGGNLVATRRLTT